MDYQPAASFPPQKSNSMATTSLVSGIVGWVLVLVNLCVNFALMPLIGAATAGIGFAGYACTGLLGCLSPIAWLVGVITGHMAKSQIKKTREGGNGKATWGLVLSYVGLGLLVLGLCILLVVIVLAVAGVMTMPVFLQGVPGFENY